MRKYLIALGLLTFSASNAQFSKGDTYLTGSLGFSHTKYNSMDEQRLTDANFSPSLMFFRTDKKVIGFRLFGSYQTHDLNASSFHNRKVHGVGFGVFSQNILPLGQSFFASLEKGINANYRWGYIQSNIGSVYDNDAKLSGYNAMVYLTPGIGYKISKRLFGSVIFNNVVVLGFDHLKQTPKTPAGLAVVRTNQYFFSSSIVNNTVGGLGIGFAWKIN